MIERQELHCHNCDKYVQFDLDLSLNGNHVLECPNCGHEHCRVVKNGQITLDRWDSRNDNTIMVNSSSCTYTTLSVDTTSSATCSYTNDLWFNYGATSSNG